MLYILGIAICLAALLQMGMWISAGLVQQNINRAHLAESRKLIRQQIQLANKNRTADSGNQTGDWKGYREFFVDRLEKNVESVISVYLKPTDEKPIVGFKAGQHLSLKFQIPGEPKPLVRCYSLSTGPGKEYYRISVKAVPAPPDKPNLSPGKISNFINSQLIEGDKIEIKAPGGSFYLNDKGKAPVVLLAGGIGITPMLSMVEDLISRSSERLVVLFYGIRCGNEHTFKEYLKNAASQNENFHVVNCYSDPNPEDKLNDDYHVHGFVSVDLIKSLLPDNKCQFYLCGPPPFMNSVRNGLLDWDVPENRIMFEAFGPASIKKAAPKTSSLVGKSASGCTVAFAESKKRCDWDSEFDSILALAEANEVQMDSGCRAGSCGTCATSIVSGEVVYPDGVVPDCAANECLACIAKPRGSIELDV